MISQFNDVVTAIAQGGHVHGSAGCNNYQGVIETEDGELRFGPFASTRMMCADAVMDQEERFLAALGKGKRFER